MYSHGPLHTDDQQEHIYNSSVLIQNVVWKICRERWTIETSRERDSGKSVLAVRHDDDNDIYVYQQLLFFNAISCLYIHIYISTIIGYLMPNPLYTFILNIYDL